MFAFRLLCCATAVLLLAASVHPAAASVTFGPGGSGVTVGSSSLINRLDLSDTFTGAPDGGSNPLRVYAAAIQPAGAYVVENTYGNSTRSWQANFSFASDRSNTNPGLSDGTPAYPGNAGSNENTSGSGSLTGFTQTGGAVDYGVAFGLRNKFVAQFDAVQMTDRIDITTSGTYSGIADAAGLSVFFRPVGSGLPQIGIYRAGVGETNSGLTSGFAGNTWNNYAVAFDRPNNRIEVFVNEISRGVIDLNTFAGGAYANFSVANVNLGGSGGSRAWTDNAQIGVRDPVGPADLVSFWNFNESASGTGTAWDQAHTNNGAFIGTTTRAAGLIGTGAARFTQAGGQGVNVGSGQVGPNNFFSFTTGLTIETLFTTTWNGGTEAEFFRKEDGGNRILFSFQSPGNINNAFGQLVGTAGVPGIALGLNIGGVYAEMDVALDGLGGRPTLAQVANGQVHHLVATYDAATGVKTMWLDNRLIAMLDLADNQLIASGGGAGGFIGSSNGGEPFLGTIDEMAIYRRALTGVEIDDHYRRVIAGLDYFWVPEPSTGLLAALGGLGLALAGWRSARRRRPA